LDISVLLFIIGLGRHRPAAVGRCTRPRPCTRRESHVSCPVPPGSTASGATGMPTRLRHAFKVLRCAQGPGVV